jgi:predicted RNase H-like nuclease (RuvC/YqgF family)
MEQLIELLPTIIGALLVVGGGIFTLVRWLFRQEEERREERQSERDKIEAAKRETEDQIWARANETIDRLREEVRILREDNKVLRKEICDLRDELHILTKLLEENSI